MKSFPIILAFMVLLFSSACSHSTSFRFNQARSGSDHFTLENRDYQINTRPVKLRLNLSHNAIINIDLRSIADFVQPMNVDGDQKVWPYETTLQPWAICYISF